MRRGSCRNPQAEEAPLRFVSAASLFDGHDAAINIIRRLLQAHGAEVVHLGHNRSVADIVRAAIQEDADGIAVSSYQGGHNEYFRYMVDMLRERGAGHIRVVVGGGGTIAPHEIEELEAYGVERIYTPEDGRKLGLDGMIADVIRRTRASRRAAVRVRAHGAARPPADRARDLRARTRRRAGRTARDAAQVGRARAAPRAGGRHHRHRRRRQVEPHRRAAAAAGAALPGPQHRGRGDGSHASPQRRRAARRPHPHERARGRAGVHALARHAPAEPRDQRGAGRRARAAAPRGLRPDRGRDRGHRPERHRDRRPRGRAAVRDDQRVRRGEPAREDRHARLRRAGRAQQVREARRRGRAARRAQAVAAQPHGLPAAGRGGAGVPDHREPLQRPGREPPVRRPVPQARGEGGRGRARLGRGRRRARPNSSNATRWCRRAARAISPRSPRTAVGRRTTCSTAPRRRAAPTACTRRCARSRIRRCPRRSSAIRREALADAWRRLACPAARGLQRRPRGRGRRGRRAAAPLAGDREVGDRRRVRATRCAAARSAARTTPRR